MNWTFPIETTVPVVITLPNGWTISLEDNGQSDHPNADACCYIETFPERNIQILLSARANDTVGTLYAALCHAYGRDTVAVTREAILMAVESPHASLWQVAAVLAGAFDPDNTWHPPDDFDSEDCPLPDGTILQYRDPGEEVDDAVRKVLRLAAPTGDERCEQPDLLLEAYYDQERIDDVSQILYTLTFSGAFVARVAECVAHLQRRFPSDEITVIEDGVVQIRGPLEGLYIWAIATALAEVFTNTEAN